MMSEAKYSTPWLQQWLEKSHEPSFQSTLDNIGKFGWEAMLITGKEQSSSFAYSVGLYDTLDFPELITVGLPLEVAHSALSYAVDEMKAGRDLTKGRYRGIVGQVEVEFRPVAQRWFRHVMCRTDWYYGYGKKEIPSLQLIYPDLENRFQWDEGFNSYFRQPMLAPGVEDGPSEKDFWAANDPGSSLFNWKFPDPPHTGVFLSKSVQEKQEPITYVSHEEKDGAWQFLGPKMSDGGGPVISCFHHPVDDDRSLEELSDLPLGWYAVREKPGDSWERYEIGPEDNE